MSKPPYFVYTARPNVRVRLRGLFERGPLLDLLERPPALRDAGWSMETQEQARIVKGEYLEIAAGDWKTLQLYEDGMLLAKVRADADFLGWGSRAEGFETHPRLNSLAVIEFTYSFVDVFSRVLEHADSQPAECVLQINVQNANRESGSLYLNPFAIDSIPYLLGDIKYLAPSDSGQVQVTVNTSVVRTNVARAAYLLIERLYLWFSMPIEEIPYTTGTGDSKVIDVDVLKRGGKAQ